MLSKPATKYITMDLTTTPQSLENGASLIVHSVLVRATTIGQNAFVNLLERDGVTIITTLYLDITDTGETTVLNAPFLADKGLSLSVLANTAEIVIFYSDVGI